VSTAPIGTTSRWTGFWQRGGFSRALLVVVAYAVLYLGAGQLSGAIGGEHVNLDDLFSSADSVFFGLTLPLMLGSAILAAFVTSVRWWARLFGRQPVRGRRWMWLAPVVVAVPIVLRLLGIDYGRYVSGVVVLTLVTGLFIGFAEEVLTRGIVVRMLRDRGHTERAVMLLSSLLFALLHTINLLSGMTIGTVAVTVVYTFAFGVIMYLTLRVTGSLVWPIVLHALFDPTEFLALGGVDAASSGSTNPLLALAVPFNVVFIVFAAVAVFLVRGRTAEPDPVATG